jgi:hypothetical protein
MVAMGKAPPRASQPSSKLALAKTIVWSSKFLDLMYVLKLYLALEQNLKE